MYKFSYVTFRLMTSCPTDEGTPKAFIQKENNPRVRVINKRKQDNQLLQKWVVYGVSFAVV